MASLGKIAKQILMNVLQVPAKTKGPAMICPTVTIVLVHMDIMETSVNQKVVNVPRCLARMMELVLKVTAAYQVIYVLVQQALVEAIVILILMNVPATLVKMGVVVRT